MRFTLPIHNERCENTCESQNSPRKLHVLIPLECENSVQIHSLKFSTLSITTFFELTKQCNYIKHPMMLFASLILANCYYLLYIWESRFKFTLRERITYHPGQIIRFVF